MMSGEHLQSQAAGRDLHPRRSDSLRRSVSVPMGPRPDDPVLKPIFTFSEKVKPAPPATLSQNDAVSESHQETVPEQREGAVFEPTLTEKKLEASLISKIISKISRSLGRNPQKD